MKLLIVLMGACLCAPSQSQNPRFAGPRTVALPKTAPAVATPEKPEAGPLPIPPDKQEAISRKMLILQQAQLELQGSQLAYASAQRKVEAAQAEYESAVEAERKLRHAEDCALTIEKQWQCAAKPEAKK